MTKPWVIYCRVSTDEQALHGIGLEVQRTQCQAMATATAAHVSHVLVDDGYSGKDLKRPQVRRLVEMIERDEIAGVLIWKLDRLTRSLRDLLHLVDLIDKHQVALVSIHERIDTSGPMGRFTLHIMGAVAQLERETIALRVSTAMAHLRAKGHWVGGARPIGTRVTGTRGAFMCEVDPVTAPAVRAAFQACVDGKPLAHIAVDLHQAKVYPKLPSPAMVGRAIRNRRSVEFGVTPSALFEAAGRALDGRKHTQGATLTPRSTDRIWILAGLAVCGQCGSSLIGVRAGGRSKSYPYLRCAGRNRRTCTLSDLPAEAWEKVTREALDQAWRDGTWLAAWHAWLAEVRTLAAPDQAKRTELQAELGQQRAKVDRLVAFIADGDATSATAKPALQTCQQAIQRIELALADIEGRTAASDLAAAGVASVQQLIDSGTQILASDDRAEQQRLLKSCVARVVIHADPASIELQLLMPRKGDPNKRTGAAKSGRRFVELDQMVEQSVRSSNPTISYKVDLLRSRQGWRVGLTVRTVPVAGGSADVAAQLGISRRHAQRYVARRDSHVEQDAGLPVVRVF